MGKPTSKPKNYRRTILRLPDLRSTSCQISSAAHGEPRNRRARTISVLSNPKSRCSVSISGLPAWLAM